MFSPIAIIPKFKDERSKQIVLRAIDILVLAAHFGIVLFISLHHEPWRDEAQTWVMARDAGLFDFFKEIKYQAHAPLWYFLLFPLAKTGLPFIAQQIFHAFIASAAATVLVWFAPLPRITKYAFIFSYFAMFVYAIIARNYVLTVLTAFLVAALYPKRFDRPLTFGFLVALLFLSSVFSFTLAGAIALLFAWQAYRDKCLNSRTAGALALMLSGAALTFYFVGMSPADSPHAPQLAFHPGEFVNAFHRSLFPILMRIVPRPVPLAPMVLASIIVGSCLVGFIERPRALFYLLAGYATPMAIFVFFRPGALRHYGMLAVFLLFSLWISRINMIQGATRDSVAPRKSLLNFARQCGVISFTICLLYSIQVTHYFMMTEYNLTFSGAKQMAKKLDEIDQKLQISKHTIVAYPPPYGTSVAAHLPGWRFWYPGIDDFATYWHTKSGAGFATEMGQRELVKYAAEKLAYPKLIFFLTKKPLDFKEAAGYGIRLVYKVEKSVWGTGRERYYLHKAVLQKKT